MYTFGPRGEFKNLQPSQLHHQFAYAQRLARPALPSVICVAWISQVRCALLSRGGAGKGKKDKKDKKAAGKKDRRDVDEGALQAAAAAAAAAASQVFEHRVGCLLARRELKGNIIISHGSKSDPIHDKYKGSYLVIILFEQYRACLIQA